MEPASSYSHSESAEFHLIMNVCGENPIMAATPSSLQKTQEERQGGGI